MDRLRASGKILLSLVAEEDGEIFGHVLFSPVALNAQDGLYAGVGLGPVAVRPDRQRQGIGSALIRAGLERMRALRIPVIYLEGNPRYYSRFGFSDASLAGITCEFNPPPGCFMLLELAPGSLAGRQGVVTYPEEFQSNESPR